MILQWRLITYLTEQDSTFTHITASLVQKSSTLHRQLHNKLMRLLKTKSHFINITDKWVHVTLYEWALHKFVKFICALAPLLLRWSKTKNRKTQFIIIRSVCWDCFVLTGNTNSKCKLLIAKQPKQSLIIQTLWAEPKLDPLNSYLNSNIQNVITHINCSTVTLKPPNLYCAAKKKPYCEYSSIHTSWQGWFFLSWFGVQTWLAELFYSKYSEKQGKSLIELAAIYINQFHTIL